jgi:predicted Fe-Mo cluster-binding NifX family protein
VRLAIAASGCCLVSPVAQKFEEASYEVLFDSRSGAWGSYDLKKQCGWPVDVWIAGHVGPESLEVFRKAGISVYVRANGTVRQAIDDYQDGDLVCAASAPVRRCRHEDGQSIDRGDDS